MSFGSVPSVSVSDVPEPGPSAALLDVREDDEWTAGHAPGALHVPMGDVPSRMADISVDGTLRGVPPGWAFGPRRRVPAARGVDAVNVDGGMVAWQQAGLPVVDDAGRPATVY